MCSSWKCTGVHVQVQPLGSIVKVKAGIMRSSQIATQILGCFTELHRQQPLCQRQPRGFLDSKSRVFLTFHATLPLPPTPCGGGPGGGRGGPKGCIQCARGAGSWTRTEKINRGVRRFLARQGVTVISAERTSNLFSFIPGSKVE